MRRPSFPRLLAPCLVAAGLAGCGGQQPVSQIEPKDTAPVAPGAAKPAPSLEGGPGPRGAPAGTAPGAAKDDGTAPRDGLVKLLDLPADRAPALTKDERYDGALLDALGKMADRNYADALTALEAARGARDTEQVRLEIARVKRLIERQKAAEQTRHDVQAVLDEGKADDAAKLAAAALQQYGGGDDAEALARLKRQADALAAAQVEGAAARRARFVRDGDAAADAKNLRAAVIAYEQALALGDDPALRPRLDDLRGTLSRYDDGRKRARELRRDPADLELAIAALQDADKAWDTEEVRQEIDDCTLALQKRRDRVGVADFEVRGDVGIPDAARAVAEELLPAFRPRFDLVERGQLGRVLDELHVGMGDVAANDEARQHLAQLARVRYLVVGSVTPLSGLTVNARLVEVRTGLVVQTAKLVAAGPDDLLRRLPKLAALLQMTDEQKIAFEADLAAAEAAEVRPAEVVPLPPPPPDVVVVAPPPIVVYTPRPAPAGGLVIEDFRRLPPPPERGDFSLDLFVARDNPVKGRLLSVSVELGDNLFRRGQYREAQRHFELALTLSKGREEISARLDRCKKLLPPPPPPPVVVVQPGVVAVAPPPLVVAARPRVAVFTFLVDAPPGLVPAGCDNWAADQLGACFAATHEVIDRGEVCWWMGRLGLTMKDVLADPSARVALASALDARFFVFGGMRHTASFDVTTTMVDARNGSRAGGGFIHVQDQAEMKLRMQELVNQTTGTAAQAARLAQQGKESEKAVNDARKLLQAGKYAEASAAAKAGLAKGPKSAALQSLQAQADRQAENARLEAARRQQAALRAAQAEAATTQQQELAKQAEAAKARARQDAKGRDEAARRAREEQKQRASDALVVRARQAAKAGNPQQAAGIYDGALALKPDAAITRERDRAKADADQAAKAKADAEAARREAEAKRQRDARLVAARAKVGEEQKQRDAAAAEEHKAREQRDAAEQGRLIEQARGFLAKGQYDAAAGAVQAARHVRKSDEVEKLAAQVQEARARADAEAKGARAKAELEKQLAADKAARDQADAAAQQKQRQYQAALTEAQRALAEKRYDQAVAKYNEAGRLFRTDAVLSGIKQAQGAKAQDAAALARQQAEAERMKREADARAAMKQVPPYQPPPAPPAEHARQMGAAAALEKQQKYAEAALAYRAALKAVPNDATAAKGADFAQHVADGQKALAARKFPDAAREFEAALKVMPGNADATGFLKRARENRP